MAQYRLTVNELEKVSSKALNQIQSQGVLEGTSNDPIFLVTIITGSMEWNASDFAAGDVLTAMSGAAGEQIRCRYRYEAGVDASSFSAHNLRWDRPEGDVLYTNIVSRNASETVTNATNGIVAAVESMLA